MREAGPLLVLLVVLLALVVALVAPRAEAGFGAAQGTADGRGGWSFNTAQGTPGGWPPAQGW